MTHPACGQCDSCLSDHDYLCTNIKIPGHQTDGGYAEYISRPENQLLPAPEGVSYEKIACCIWSYACVWNVVSRRGNLRPGQSVLITGASGGLGTAAIQLSRLAGASLIIGTTGSPAKAEKLMELGLDHVVNYSETDAVDQIKSHTGGRGVDLVIDLVGGEMFVLGLNSLCMGGTIVNVAGEEATNSIPMRMLTVMLLHRYVNILGVRGAKRIDNKRVLQFLGEGEIDPVIDQVMPLSEAVKAHEILENQEHIGKIVLVP
jgi:NADPH:quinone reductase-like Zn-dependent oxidoreductase